MNYIRGLQAKITRIRGNLSTRLSDDRNKRNLVIIALIIYLIFSFSPFQHLGMVIVMASLLPVILAGYFFGFRTGLIGGIILFSTNIILVYFLRNYKDSEINLFTDIILSGHVIIPIGGLVGYLSDLKKKLTIELNRGKLNKIELEQQKKQIGEILDLQPDIICRFSKDLRLIYINKAGSIFFRTPEEQLLEKKIPDLFPEKERAYIKNYIDDIQLNQDGNQDFIVLPLYAPNGEKYYFQWSVTQINNSPDEKVIFQTVGRNISEQYKSKLSERENLAIAESLKTIASILNSSLDINDVLNKVLRNIGRVVPHDAANIMLVEDQYAKMVQTVGYEKFISNLDEFQKIEFPLNLSNLNQMATDHHAILISDIDFYPGWVKLEQNKWINSYLGAPLIFKNELIGFLNLDSTRKNFFNEKHAIWLQAFADQAVIAIKNARYFEEANKRTFQLSKFNEIMRVSIYAQKIEEIMEAASSIFKEIFHSEFEQFFLCNEKENSFQYFPVSPNLIEDGNSDPKLLIYQAMALEIIQKNEIYDFNQFVKNESMVNNVRSEKNEQPFVIIPLSVDNRAIGLIQLIFNDFLQLEQAEKDLMQQFAYQISMAILKIQLMDLESERSRELAHTNQLLEIFTKVSGLIEMQLVLPDLFRTLGDELRNHQINCMITLEEEGEPIQIAYHSLFDIEKNTSINNDSSILELIQNFINRAPIFRNIINQRGTLFIPQLNFFINELKPFLESSEFDMLLPLLESNGNESGFAIPLINNDHVIGTIAIFNENLKQSDLSSVTLFADQIANAIEKSKLYLEISQLAITDPLTGFYNRRGLEELGKHEIERSIRFSRNLSALMIDLDYFKQINDHHGHMIGDQILEQIAVCIRHNLRDADILCRFGGEEFFILLPEADVIEASGIAERLRNAIANTLFHTSSGPINATISIGICKLSKEIDNLNEMIRFADRALYLAKESGRNCVKYLPAN